MPKLLMIVLLAFLASGCARTLVGAGATVGVAAMEERGVKDAANDLAIKATILRTWFELDHVLPLKLGAEVYQGRALLTGVAPDNDVRSQVVALAWKPEGVKEVLNEILLKAEVRDDDFARDAWIVAQVRGVLIADERIYAINYAVKSVAGRVYLIGTARSQDELDRVIGHARNISYVRRVINHVRVIDGAKP